VLDFDELGAVLSEKLIGFWSSFYGSWFAAEGPDVDEFGVAGRFDIVGDCQIVIG
jgi:hypothetical protein